MDADIGHGSEPLINLMLYIRQAGETSRGPEVLTQVLYTSFYLAFFLWRPYITGPRDNLQGP
jgi:hypothetical protein